MVCPIPRSGRSGFVADYTGAVLTRFSRIRNWRLESIVNPEVRIYPGTRFGEQLLDGFIDHTGSFSGWGALPPLFAGDKFTFLGYTAPTNGIPCTPGCTYVLPSIVTALTITWNWTQENKRTFWEIEFASNGTLVPSEMDDPCDDSVYCDPSICTCPEWQDCYFNDFEFCNLTQAVLRFDSNPIPYSNCSTGCIVKREPGHLTWMLDVTDQNPCTIPTLQTDYKVFLPAAITEPTWWEIEWLRFVGVSNRVVDTETDEMISKVNRFRGQAVNCCGETPVRGSIISPAAAVLWPYATPA